MTLTLKIASQSFCMTLRPIMMHHNTMFGIKMFDGLEDIIRTNSNVLTFAVPLTLNAVIHFFHRTLCLIMIYHQTKDGYRGINSSENKFESYSDHISPCCDVDFENSKLIFCMRLWLMMIQLNTKFVFGKKMFSGLEDIIWTNVI